MPSFNLFDPRILSIINVKGLNLCTTISEGLKSTCKEVLLEGVKEGWDIRRIRDGLMEAVEGYSKVDAERTARTEIIRSSREAGAIADEQSGVVSSEIWTASPDACPECLELDGQEFGFDEIPDSHPNCLLPENKVIVPSLEAGSRAFYSGDALEIRTRRGNNISLTPNHMILTPSGFIKAKFLHEGDYIITSPHSQRIASIINPNDDYVPTFIEDKWNSLLMQPSMMLRVMPTSPVDFYGDASGFQGNINIIDTDSFLVNNVGNSSRFKHISKFNFQRRNSQPLKLSGFCSLRSVFNRSFCSPNGIVRGFGNSRPIFRRGICHSNKHRLANISRGNSSLNQVSTDYTPTYTALSSQFLFRFAPLITSDDIIKIRKYNFSGHVYDLQSTSQLYLANDIVVKNCRCSLRAVLKND